MPLRLRVGDAELSLLSTTTVFGTPREVTLSELAIEAFYPGDEATRAALTGEIPRLKSPSTRSIQGTFDRDYPVAQPDHHHGVGVGQAAAPAVLAAVARVSSRARPERTRQRRRAATVGESGLSARSVTA